jgi:4-amino-4-deoxy-L-arabinose transferase-like glycosyltransferase
MTTRGFALRLTVIAAAAMAIRLVYAFVVVRDAPLLGDALEFHLQANALADGLGYVQPFVLRDTGVAHPSADKPPVFTLLEAGVSLLGGRSWAWHHLVGVLAGTGTVVACGVLGRRLTGAGAGLLAAGLAATYPVMVATDGSLRSESVYALAVALALLAALRLRESPSIARAAVLGAAIAVAALVRSEALLLLVLLAFPVAGLRHGAVAAAACLVVLTPWLARCWVAFDRPVLVSTNVGGLLAGANCDTTYAGALLGQWDFGCLPPPVSANEAVESAVLRDRGLRYARDHAGRLPVVVAARVGRTFELYRPNQNAHMEHFYEGRDLRVAQAGTVTFYVLAVLAAVGAAGVRRRSGPVWILLAPVALVVVATAISYGFTRFRIAAEPGLVVLAAFGLMAIRDRRRHRAGGTGGTSARSRNRALTASAGS